jgi:hypothetical protein
MKKNNRLRLLAFVLVAVVFLAAAVPAYAAMVAKNIEVYTGAKIFVNGRELHPTDVKGNELETFIYEGTTYIPLRAVSEALGAEVSWNSEYKTAYINTERVGDNPEDRVAKYDAGSGVMTYTCGPMELSSQYCTAYLDGFTVVDSRVAFCDPYYIPQVRLYELFVIITGTVKASNGGYFLCYANCFDAEGVLLRSEKIYQEMEENVPFKIRYPLDVPADTVRIVLTADRMD